MENEQEYRNEIPIRERFRRHAPILIVVLLIALVANFIIFVLYYQQQVTIIELLKECDPVKICEQVLFPINTG